MEVEEASLSEAHWESLAEVAEEECWQVLRHAGIQSAPVLGILQVEVGELDLCLESAEVLLDFLHP